MAQELPQPLNPVGTVPAGFPWVLLAVLNATFLLLSVAGLCLLHLYISPKPSEMRLPKTLVSDGHGDPCTSFPPPLRASQCSQALLHGRRCCLCNFWENSEIFLGGRSAAGLTQGILSQQNGAINLHFLQEKPHGNTHQGSPSPQILFPLFNPISRDCGWHLWAHK